MGTLYKRGTGKKWYGEYTGPDGRRIRKSTGTSVKSDAAKILAVWETEANLQANGVIGTAKATLSDLVDEYIAYLGNNGTQHRELTEQRIRRVIEANEWTNAQQINQLGVENAVRNFVSLTSNQDIPLSLRSQGHYIGSMKAFTRWLVRLRRALVRDPLEAVKKPAFDHARKRVRRYLLHEEWTWLSQTPNALLYETAIETGLRSNELRSLQPSHLQDDHILLPAKFTKNKRAAKQWITKDLATRLRDQLPFAMPPKEEVATMLYNDLALSREAWLAAKNKTPADFLLPTNTNGETLDFHSLRHTCGAWLAIANINVKVIQSVMRHSTIVLTLDTYGHLMPGAESTAVEELGRLLRTHSKNGS